MQFKFTWATAEGREDSIVVCDVSSHAEAMGFATRHRRQNPLLGFSWKDKFTTYCYNHARNFSFCDHI